MKTNILGFPRMGAYRELKKAEEGFWAGKLSQEELFKVAFQVKKENWEIQNNAGIDLIPSNDFSLYDQVLDMSFSLGAIPARYESLKKDKLDLYFAMAHGKQSEGTDVIAMEMTKWFDTNYHYIVPEFTENQAFSLFYNKPAQEFEEALKAGFKTKPVLIGPVSYLLLGKEKDNSNRLNLLDKLLPVYIEILKSLENLGAEYVQIDEPFLNTDIDNDIKAAYKKAFDFINKNTKLKIILTTYFDGLNENAEFAAGLNTYALHIDLVRCPEQLDLVLNALNDKTILSLGVVDGRNIWKNDFNDSLSQIKKAINKIGEDRIIIASSCSLLHVPFDLDNEHNENTLTKEIKRWMAFAKQKTVEIVTIADLASKNPSALSKANLEQNTRDQEDRKTSSLIHNQAVTERTNALTAKDKKRNAPYPERAKLQHEILQLPLFPTTTIGSFPQTKEVRSWRSKFKKGELSKEAYTVLLKDETLRTIKRQEEIGLDVLVHGEFERNDMVEYFGEQLDGFTFSANGWVQSYGSRCVKPPIIFGDISRPHAMTVDWIVYAQSLTKLPVKGMLTGPITILQWSFVRNDQPRKDTAQQIALAIRDEAVDLEKAGIKIIQIDEPAIREGLPIRKASRKTYLDWSVECFIISTAGVKDETQIHTHMCYSEFNDIIENIAKMDADVITIECSRSQMELLDAFAKFKYPNEIGPGVYDIHSPRVPTVDEIVELLKKAAKVIPAELLWVNPDCGLKTRGWEETEASLKNMILAAKLLRKECRN